MVRASTSVLCLSLQYEILFCVQSVSDPSLRVVEDLRQVYPHVDIRVLTGRCGT